MTPANRMAPPPELPPLIPVPAALARLGGSVRLDPSAGLRTDGPDPQVDRVGDHLAGRVGVERTGSPSAAVVLGLDGDPSLGGEGYELVADDDRVTIRAYRPAGLFRGGQTLDQLLPARPGGPLEVPAVRLRDVPRFAWRGLMLDVARHFFGVEDVKRVIDLAAAYHLNVLHLHLTDDQGWRIAIDRWPALTAVGGRAQVGGGPGGFYTKADYAAIVDYAAARYITVVPEVDVPGHTSAALTAYPELACDGRAPPLYTGIEVGFSSLCVDRPVTRRFLAEVFAEVAEMTPGGHVHLGGDEALTLSAESYGQFVAAVQDVVLGTGKLPIGWQEVASAPLRPRTVVQYWNPNAGAAPVTEAVRRGARVILSPADRVYLDMKYDRASRLGQDWAGHVDVRTAYDWDPATLVDRVAEPEVLGVEAALWTETITTIGEVEFMLLPRLAAVAELAWSPQEVRNWPGFRRRLAGHGPRWAASGTTFHRTDEIDWPAGSVR
jgi:hexosaminidase